MVGADAAGRRRPRHRAGRGLADSALPHGRRDHRPRLHHVRSHGLLVAGEDAGGVHGANRLGGNGVAESTVFGARAGRGGRGDRAGEGHLHARPGAGRRVGRARATRRWAATAGRAVRAHATGSRRRCGALRPRAQRAPGSARRESALDGAHRGVVAASPCTGRREANPAWQEALDLESQLTVARLIVESALAREESRGAHFRSDFPERDDERWLRRVVVALGRGRRDRADDAAGRADPTGTGRPGAGAGVSALQTCLRSGAQRRSSPACWSSPHSRCGSRSPTAPARRRAVAGSSGSAARATATCSAGRSSHTARPGVAVFAFLLLHVLDVALYAISPARFDEVHELYGTTPLRVFECALLFAILFHTLNGLRLVLPRRRRRSGHRQRRGGCCTSPSRSPSVGGRWRRPFVIHEAGARVMQPRLARLPRHARHGARCWRCSCSATSPSRTSSTTSRRPARASWRGAGRRRSGSRGTGRCSPRRSCTPAPASGS